jgi:hypothetical protein
VNKISLSHVLTFLFYLFFNLVLHKVFSKLIMGVFMATGMSMANDFSEGDEIYIGMFIGGIVALPTLLIMLVGILIAYTTKRSIKPFLYIGLMFAITIVIAYTFGVLSILELLQTDWGFNGETDGGK